MKKLSGFTLMELMVVISIILLLSIAITATLSVSFEKAKRGKAIAEMAEIATACKMYYKDTGAWPDHIARLLSEVTVAYGYNQYGVISYAAFDISKWKGPYLMTFIKMGAWKEVLDPWNKNYLLSLNTLEPNRKLYVVSSGGSTDPSKQLKVLVHKFKKP